MSRIVAARVVPYCSTLRAAHVDARGGFSERRGMLLELRDAGGRVGWGDCAPLEPFSPGIDICRAALESCLPRLTGCEPDITWADEPPPWLQELPGPVVAAIETAAGFLIAARAGVSLSALLAGPGSSPATRLPVNALVDRDDEADALAQASAAAAEGYVSFKVKLGPGAANARRRLELLRERLGSAAEIRVDANGSWSPETLVELAPALHAAGVALVEQPLAPGIPGEPGRLATLRRSTGLRIAADESMALPSAEALLKTEGALDAVVLKPSLLGLRASARLARMARARGLDVIVTGTFESGVGFAATLETAAAVASPGVAQGLATSLAVVNDPVAGVPRAHAGFIDLPASGVVPSVVLALPGCRA